MRIGLILSTLILLSFSTVVAQSVSSEGRTRGQCGNTHIENEMMRNNPALMQEYNRQQNEILEAYMSQPESQRSSASTIVIPVVVHNIHDDGIGYLSDAQIHAAIDMMNEDFRLENADTNLINPLFWPIAAGMDVEFRLAKKDPNGNCTDGIVRVNSEVTSTGSGGGSDPITAVSQWPITKYYNIWTTKDISGGGGGGTILAYSPFALMYQAGQFSHWGIVCRFNCFGPLSNSFGPGADRTLTHEAGHSFNLRHTFQSGCGGNCTTSGDLICDTPPVQSATFGCPSANTCSNDAVGGNGSNPNPWTTNVIDNVNNHMDYASCPRMFTSTQINTMLAVMTGSTYNWIQNLVSANNLVATGTDDAFWPTAPDCAPVAEFSWDRDLVCGGGTVNFTDWSYNAVQDPTWTWSWNFPGGTPNQSTAQNPTVTYSTPGIYGVTLTTSNSVGSSAPVTKTGIIEVVDGMGVLGPGTEDFTNPQFPNNIIEPEKSWEITQNPTNVIKWVRSTTAFYSSPASLYLNQAFVPNGNENYLTSPGYDLSAYSDSVFLRYAVAHAPSSGGGNDQLRILVSDDCGVTWDNVKIELSSGLYSNGGTVADNFTPANQGEWIIKEVDLSNYAGASKVLLRFLARSGGNNNFWLDDITIYHGVFSGLEKITDIEFVELFPNPSSGKINLSFELYNDSEVDFVIMDPIGKETTLLTEFHNSGTVTKEFDLSSMGLTPGMYMLRISSENGASVQKLIIR